MTQSHIESKVVDRALFTRPFFYSGNGHHSPRTLAQIMFVAGMWSVAEQQWKDTKFLLPQDRFKISIHEYPGHGKRADEGLNWKLEDYVEDLVRELRKKTESQVIVAHSLGAHVAALAAVIVPEKIKAIVTIASTPPSGIKTPNKWVTKLSNPKYLPALFGWPFTLTEGDERFVTGGCQISLQAESGHILREVINGVEVPRFSYIEMEYGISVRMIIPLNDQFVPYTTALDTASKYHGMCSKKIHLLDGGHFLFCERENKENFYSKLAEIVGVL